MPLAISLGSLEPDSVMLWKVMIMPITVPISPSSGPAATASRRKAWKRSSRGTSRSTASEIRSCDDLRILLDAARIDLDRAQHAPERIVVAGVVEIGELAADRHARADQEGHLVEGGAGRRSRRPR